MESPRNEAISCYRLFKKGKNVAHNGKPNNKESYTMFKDKKVLGVLPVYLETIL